MQRSKAARLVRAAGLICRRSVTVTGVTHTATDAHDCQLADCSCLFQMPTYRAWSSTASCTTARSRTTTDSGRRSATALSLQRSGALKQVWTRAMSRAAAHSLYTRRTVMRVCVCLFCADGPNTHPLDDALQTSQSVSDTKSKRAHRSLCHTDVRSLSVVLRDAPVPRMPDCQ